MLLPAALRKRAFRWGQQVQKRDHQWNAVAFAKLERSSNGPARPVLGPQKLVGLVTVGDAERDRIPEELLAGQFLAQVRSQGHVAERDGLRDRTTEVKI